MDFFMTLVQIQVTEEVYPAQVAQLSHSIKSSDKGVMVSVWGYNEKLHVNIIFLQISLNEFFVE